MDKIGPNKSEWARRLTGVLALSLLVLVNFQPALISTALWLAAAHGHDHQIVVRADGDHVDVRLSHPEDQAAATPHHESSFGLVATLLSTHDHEGDVHVLHFHHGEIPDQLRSRAGIAPALPPQWVWLANDLTPATVALPTTAPAAPARPPPALALSLLCLGTTVLVI